MTNYNAMIITLKDYASAMHQERANLQDAGKDKDAIKHLCHAAAAQWAIDVLRKERDRVKDDNGEVIYSGYHPDKHYARLIASKARRKMAGQRQTVNVIINSDTAWCYLTNNTLDQEQTRVAEDLAGQVVDGYPWIYNAWERLITLPRAWYTMECNDGHIRVEDDMWSAWEVVYHASNDSIYLVRADGTSPERKAVLNRKKR